MQALTSAEVGEGNAKKQVGVTVEDQRRALLLMLIASSSVSVDY